MLSPKNPIRRFIRRNFPTKKDIELSKQFSTAQVCLRLPVLHESLPISAVNGDIFRMEGQKYIYRNHKWINVNASSMRNFFPVPAQVMFPLAGDLKVGYTFPPNPDEQDLVYVLNTHCLYIYRKGGWETV